MCVCVCVSDVSHGDACMLVAESSFCANRLEFSIGQAHISVLAVLAYNSKWRGLT